MNIRLKFLIIFSISAFAALSFFGYVAYDTALEQSDRNESESMFEVFKTDLLSVSEAVKNNADIDAAVSKTKNLELLNFIVYDENHNSVYVAEPLSLLKPEHIQSLPHESNKMGAFEIGNIEYHWYTNKIPEKKLTVAALHPEFQKHTKTFFSQMGVTLIITAFIVLWSAAWSAMYIGALFEKLNAQKKELEKLATHDSLTSLPNRMLFSDRVSQAILCSLRGKAKFALCFMDLNKFKQVNDTMGHQAGDQLLQEVATRLTNKLRKSDTIARLGGDEFAFLFINVDKEGAEIAVNKVIDEIERPIILSGETINISGSVGIAMYPRHGVEADDLLRHADDAMYIAKKGGKRFYHYVDENDTQMNDSVQPLVPQASVNNG